MLEWSGWDYLQVIACAVGLVASVLFVGRYLHEAGRAAWRDPFGRFMLTRKALLACLFLLVLVNRAHGGIESPDSWQGQDLATALVFGAFALQTFIPYRLLISAQRAHIEKEAQR